MTLLSWSVLIIVYLGGYAATYFSARYFFKQNNDPWTVKVKLMVVLFSLLSWLLILYTAIIFLLGQLKIINLQKQAKW